MRYFYRKNPYLVSTIVVFNGINFLAFAKVDI